MRENVKCTKCLFLAVPGQIIQERDYFRKKVVCLQAELKRLQIAQTFQDWKIKLSYQIKAVAIKKQLQGEDQTQGIK